MALFSGSFTFEGAYYIRQRAFPQRTPVQGVVTRKQRNKKNALLAEILDVHPYSGALFLDERGPLGF